MQPTGLQKSHKQYKSDAQSFTNMQLPSLGFQTVKYKIEWGQQYFRWGTLTVTQKD